MKNKTLLVALLILLISNAIFAYLLWGKKHNNLREDMFQTQMAQIGFDKAQADSFKAIRKLGKEQGKYVVDSLQIAHNKFIAALLKNPNDSLTILAALNESNKWVYKMDLQNYNNLLAARKLCKPDQLVAYDSMVVERMHFRFNRKHRK